MNFCLVFALFGYFFAWSSGMLYRRDSNNVLKPDLMAISSTVVPLPIYRVFDFENKLPQDKKKTRPHGKVELVTKSKE
ncbi:uncharacterized protein LOC114365262 [Ostrinia furnacalis]|uniref:uncharacterized protein LOC114365262 n=1 Tax=Ostrinia furnacalis TaxID=93504 RepID=UPI00103ADD9D|nr:uncharacterized protein LOC114365262 [Ostrinia furnacalis]